MKTYRARMGTSVKWLTAATYVVLVSVALLAAASRNRAPAMTFAFWITALTVSVLGVGGLAFRIHGYDLDSKELVIRYGFGRRVIPCADITSAESGRGVIQRSLRVFASGGLWSFLGVFRHAEIGQFRAYVSDLSKAIMLGTIGGRVLVSPSEADQFMSDLKARLPRLA